MEVSPVLLLYHCVSDIRSMRTSGQRNINAVEAGLQDSLPCPSSGAHLLFRFILSDRPDRFETCRPWSLGLQVFVGLSVHAVCCGVGRHVFKHVFIWIKST